MDLTWRTVRFASSVAVTRIYNGRFWHEWLVRYVPVVGGCGRKPHHSPVRSLWEAGN